MRFIAVNDGVDSQRGGRVRALPQSRNLFNEWYPEIPPEKSVPACRQRGTSGKHLGKPPYGYRQTRWREEWILDEDAAPIVKRIFDLCIDGKGPEQISRILERDQVLTTKALYASRKGKPMLKNPYSWSDQSIVGFWNGRNTPDAPAISRPTPSPTS